MADGYKGENGEADERRVPYVEVMRDVCRVGQYDDAAADEMFGLCPSRGAIFGFLAQIVVDGGRTFLRVSPLSEELSVFTIGTGGTTTATDTGLAGVQTDAESSAGEDGGVVRNDATWVSTGMLVQRLKPWTTAAGAGDVLTRRIDADFMLEGDGLPNYGTRLHEKLEAAAYFTMDVKGGTRKDAIEHLGPLCDWEVSAGGILLPGHFWKFSNDYGSGGENSNMELTMNVEMSRTIDVEQNAAVPFFAGQQVVIPWRVRHMGYVLCGKASKPRRGSAPRKTACAADDDTVTRGELRDIIADAVRQAVGK